MRFFPQLRTQRDGNRQPKSPPSRRERTDAITFWAFVAPNLTLFAVFTFWPLAYSIYLSFMKWNMIAPKATTILRNALQDILLGKKDIKATMEKAAADMKADYDENFKK